jgi:hypothetical protein
MPDWQARNVIRAAYGHRNHNSNVKLNGARRHNLRAHSPGQATNRLRRMPFTGRLCSPVMSWVFLRQRLFSFFPAVSLAA